MPSSSSPSSSAEPKRAFGERTAFSSKKGKEAVLQELSLSKIALADLLTVTNLRGTEPHAWMRLWMLPSSGAEGWISPRDAQVE